MRVLTITTRMQTKRGISGGAAGGKRRGDGIGEEKTHVCNHSRSTLLGRGNNM